MGKKHSKGKWQENKKNEDINEDEERKLKRAGEERKYKILAFIF